MSISLVILFISQLFLLLNISTHTHAFQYVSVISPIHCNNKRQSNGILHATAGKKYSHVVKYLKADQPRVIKPQEPDDPAQVELLNTIITAADGRKANDIVVINIKSVSDMADYVVIMEGNSKPQNQAILTTIEDEVQSKFQLKGKSNGEAASGWVLLDYGSIIVHIMFPKMRNFYKIEKKWKDGLVMDISHLIGMNSAKSTDNEILNDEDGDVVRGFDESSDPFWN